MRGIRRCACVAALQSLLEVLSVSRPRSCEVDSFVVPAYGSARRGPRTGSAAVSKDARRRSGASSTAPVVENEFLENVNESWRAGKIGQNVIISLTRSDAVPRDIFTRSVICCYSFAVFAVISLL
jgi:hypothetical protein